MEKRNRGYVFSPNGTSFSRTSSRPKATSPLTSAKALSMTSLGNLCYGNLIDPRTYTNVSSNGLTSRVAKYVSAGESPKTHGEMSKPTTSPRNPFSYYRRKPELKNTPVRSNSLSTMRIAPPEKVQFQASQRAKVFRSGSLSAISSLSRREDEPLAPSSDIEETPSPSVLDVLQEISRKRINNEELDAERIKKQCKEITESVESPVLTGKSPFPIMKRNRNNVSPTEDTHKKRQCRNNEIFSSLSSTRPLKSPPMTAKRAATESSKQTEVKKVARDEIDTVQQQNRPMVIKETAAELARVAIEPKTAAEVKPKEPPKITLFNKKYDNYKRPAVDVFESSEPEIKFVKPQKAGENFSLGLLKKPAESNKLKMLLSCLSGEIDEIDSKEEVQETPKAPALAQKEAAPVSGASFSFGSKPQEAQKPAESQKPTLEVPKPLELPKPALTAPKPLEIPKPLEVQRPAEAPRPQEAPKPIIPVEKMFSMGSQDTAPKELVSAVPPPGSTGFSFGIAKPESPSKPAFGFGNPTSVGFSMPSSTQTPASISVIKTTPPASTPAFEGFKTTQPAFSTPAPATPAASKPLISFSPIAAPPVQPKPTEKPMFGNASTPFAFGNPVEKPADKPKPQTSESAFGPPKTSAFITTPVPASAVFGTPASTALSTSPPTATSNMFGSVMKPLSAVSAAESSKPAAEAPKFSFAAPKPSDSVFGKAPEKPQSVFGSGSNSAFSSTGEQKSVFGVSTFGQSDTNKSVFGAKPAEPVVSPVFGSSTFGSKPAAAVFGSSVSPPQTSAAVFGSNSGPPNTSASVFGNNSGAPQTSASVFGSSSGPAQTSASMFGSNSGAPQTQASVFGNNSGPAQTSASVFGSNPSTPQTSASIFGNNAGTPQSPTSVFGSNLNTPQTTASIFGSNSNTPQTTASVFGNSTPQTQAPSSGGFSFQLPTASATSPSSNDNKSIFSRLGTRTEATPPTASKDLFTFSSNSGGSSESTKSPFTPQTASPFGFSATSPNFGGNENKPFVFGGASNPPPQATPSSASSAPFNFNAGSGNNNNNFAFGQGAPPPYNFAAPNAGPTFSIGTGGNNASTSRRPMRTAVRRR